MAPYLDTGGGEIWMITRSVSLRDAEGIFATSNQRSQLIEKRWIVGSVDMVVIPKAGAANALPVAVMSEPLC